MAIEIILKAKNISIYSILIYISSAVAFAGQIILAKVMSIEEYGYYRLFIEAQGLLLLVSLLGLDMAVMSLGKGGFSRRLKAVISATIVYFSFIITILAIFITNLLSYSNTYFFLVLPLMAIIRIFASFALSQRKYLISGLSNIVPGAVFIILVLLIVFSNKVNLDTIMTSFILSQLIAIPVLFFLDGQTIKNFFVSWSVYKQSIKGIKVILNRYSFVVLAECIGFLRRRADIFIIATFLTAKELGIYSFYLVLVSVLTVLYRPLSKYLIQHLKAYKTAPKKEFYMMYFKVTMLLMTTFVCISLPYFLLPDLLIRLVGKPEYLVYSNLLPIMALGNLINISTGPWQEMLMVLGFPKMDFQIRVIGLVFGVILYLLLVPIYGLLGVVLGQVVSAIFMSILGMLKVIAVKNKSLIIKA